MSQQDSLVRILKQRIDAGEVQLPVFDSVALRIHREVREGSMDADGLCLLMEKDPALVSELMKMANSSYFAGLGDIRNLREAIVRLGMNQVASIVMTGAQKRLYSASVGAFRSRLLKLWQHTLAVGKLSKWLAGRTGNAALAEEVFVVGILHDIGKLSLLTIIEELGQDNSLLFDRQDVDRVLQDMGHTHGATLLMRWQLPDTYSQAVLHHLEMSANVDDAMAGILRLANQIVICRGIDDAAKASCDFTQLPEFAAFELDADDALAIEVLMDDFSSEVKRAA